MSKVIKGIKKTFKKVVKSVKKIAPIVLAAAAIYFTAGAALGLTATWGATAASMAGGLGLGAVGTGALTGAITYAGYGALAGGVVSSATGGSFMKGAKAGAITGAVTGGVLGGATALSSAPTTAATATPTAATNAGANAATAMPDLTTGLTATPGAPGVVGATSTGLNAGGQIAANVIQPTTTGGLLSNVGTFVKDNQTLLGGAISGLGEGLGAAAEAEETGKAEIEILRERQRINDANYAGVTHNPRPTYTASFNFEYRYDPAQGRIVRVPITQG